MHKYMRAIGFSEMTDRKKLQKLVTDVVIEGTERDYTSNGDEALLASFSKDFTEKGPGYTGASIGVAVCGEEPA